MAMGHVILKEFFVDSQVDFFTQYNQQYTDLPFLVALEDAGDVADTAEGADGPAYRPGKYLVAGDLDIAQAASENAMWKPAVLDARTGDVAIPNGSIGFRYGDEGWGKWNLDLEDIDPVLTLHGLEAGGTASETARVVMPRFDAYDGKVAHVTRGVPVRRIGGRLVTTVLDLMLAQYGVARPGMPGTWPADYEDPSTPATPAWQEEIPRVPAEAAIRNPPAFGTHAVASPGPSALNMGPRLCPGFHGGRPHPVPRPAGPGSLALPLTPAHAVLALHNPSRSREGANCGFNPGIRPRSVSLRPLVIRRPPILAGLPSPSSHLSDLPWGYLASG